MIIVVTGYIGAVKGEFVKLLRERYNLFPS